MGTEIKNKLLSSLKRYEFHRTENGVLYCGNCLDILPQIPDGSVDLVLTDPPFGKVCYRGMNAIGRKKELNRTYASMAEWGIEHKPSNTEIRKIINKGKRFIVWGGNYFLEAFDSTNCFLTWNKKGNWKKSTCFADEELALTNFTHSARTFECRNQGWVKDSRDEKVDHPTPKPTELFEWCLLSEKHTQEGDLVLDPYMGSGTTAVACERNNRRWIGIEISEKYCADQVKRIEVERRQLKMFQTNTGRK